MTGQVENNVMNLTAEAGAKWGKCPFQNSWFSTILKDINPIKMESGFTVNDDQS